MDWTDALRWFGLAQGVIVLGILWSRATTQANIAMKILVLLLTVHIGVVTKLDTDAIARFPWSLALFNPMPFLYGPLVWWYVRSVVYRPPFPRARFFPHVIPYAVEASVYAVAVAIMTPETVARVAADVFRGDAPWMILASETAKLVSGVAYASAIGILIWRNRTGFSRWINGAGQRRWVIAFLVAFVINWGVVAASLLFPGERAAAQRALLVALVVLIYLVGFFAIRDPEILNPTEVRSRARAQLRITPDEVEEIVARVTKLLESGAYADETLRAPGIAKRIGTHPNRLSFAVNDSLGKTVPDLINGYRLQAFLERVKAGALASSTILGVALDVGFRSKSSFHRAFLGAYGESPATYIARTRSDS